MDDVQRQVIELQRSEAIRKRDELNVVIAYFDTLLGGPASAQQASDAISPAVQSNDPLALVNEGEFFGLSAPKAARAVLEKVGKARPLRTVEIFDAIRKGGVSFKSKEGLYKSLDRDPMFQKVGAGRWGLAEWYPKRVRADTNGGSVEPVDQNTEAPAQNGDDEEPF